MVTHFSGAGASSVLVGGHPGVHQAFIPRPHGKLTPSGGAGGLSQPG